MANTGISVRMCQGYFFVCRYLLCMYELECLQMCVCVCFYIYISIYISISICFYFYLSIFQSISVSLSFLIFVLYIYIYIYISLSLALSRCIYPVLLAFLFSRSYPSPCGTSTSNKCRFAAPFASANSRKMGRYQDITSMSRIPHFIDMFSLLFHSMDSFEGVSTWHFIVRRLFC